MRCPTLTELPPPPSAKTGWPFDVAQDRPWMEESLQLSDTMPDGRPWPRVSIVTPSYNQGQFIEETIRSVLLQGYPDLEYIIIDGGSTDGSVDIIRKYEPWLAYWVSEPDQGQSEAINKGWEWASGDIMAWLNSDDTYCPGALMRVGRAFLENPSTMMVYGDCDVVNAEGQWVGSKVMADFTLETLICGKQMPQPAVFIHRQVVEEIGEANTAFYYSMDFDYFLRVWSHYRPAQFVYIPHVLAQARTWTSNKTAKGMEKVAMERREVLDLFFSARPSTSPALKRRACSATYRKQAYSEHQQGDLPAAYCHIIKAWLLAPGVDGFVRTLRFLARTCVSRAMDLLEGIWHRLKL